MCGIVYQYNFDGTNTSRRALKQVNRQKRRGMQSFGFALPDKHKMNWKVKYEDIARELKRTVNPEVLFHQRLATSSENRPTACHPFSTKNTFDTEFVGVHNGMLWNEHELYERHKERYGIRYVSDNGKDFNDSEAYIYDLASYFSGHIEGIEMEGYGAFIVVEYDKETHERLRLHWGTTDPSSAPLKVHHTQNHLDITSEGKGWLVTKDVHYTYDYASGDITMEELVHKKGKTRSKYSPYYNSYRPYSSWDDDEYSDKWLEKYASAATSKAPNATVSQHDIELMNEDNEAILAVLDEMYPDKTECFGWSMYRGGCCERHDYEMFEDEDEAIAYYTPAEDSRRGNQQSLSAEFVAVQKAIEAEALKH